MSAGVSHSVCGGMAMLVFDSSNFVDQNKRVEQNILIDLPFSSYSYISFLGGSRSCELSSVIWNPFM